MFSNLAEFSFTTPHLSFELIALSSRLSLSSLNTVQITTRHHANPVGFPDNRPVLFRFKCDLQFQDDIFQTIDALDLHPWMIVHHQHTDDNGQRMTPKLVEVDDQFTGPPPFFDTTDPVYPPIPISGENGFVSLAVDESQTRDIECSYRDAKGLLLSLGETYSLVLKYYRIPWWRYDRIEVRRPNFKVLDIAHPWKDCLGELVNVDRKSETPKIILAASNLLQLEATK